MVRPVFQAVLERTSVGRGTRYLDAGCGAGMEAEMAAARGAEVSGVDAAEAMLSIADETFDVVTGFNSLPYAGNPVAALSEAGRVTKRGGSVVVVTFGDPDGMEVIALLTVLKPFLPPPREAQDLSRSWFRCLLARRRGVVVTTLLSSAFSGASGIRRPVAPQVSWFGDGGQRGAADQVWIGPLLLPVSMRASRRGQGATGATQATIVSPSLSSSVYLFALRAPAAPKIGNPRRPNGSGLGLHSRQARSRCEPKPKRRDTGARAQMPNLIRSCR
jgi:hypothetical protein